MTNRDSARAEVERSLGAELERSLGAEVTRLLGAEVDSTLGEGEPRVEDTPCLFCPGRVLGARGLRFLEIDGDKLGLARWARSEDKKAARKLAGPLGPAIPSTAPQHLDGSPYTRFETRSTSIRDLLGRIELSASTPGELAGGGAP